MVLARMGKVREGTRPISTKFRPDRNMGGPQVAAGERKPDFQYTLQEVVYVNVLFEKKNQHLPWSLHDGAKQSRTLLEQEPEQKSKPS